MAGSPLYIGMLSGTSVDGVDCALVRFDGDKPVLIQSHFKDYPPALRERVLTLCSGTTTDLGIVGQTHIEIGKLFASAVLELLEETEFLPKNISAIGSHGQTVWHQPDGDNPFSLQLGDPNTIVEHTGITTIADLRGRDLAAGGQGAPLAPLLHREVFYSADVDRAVVNIGGIANITMLPRTSDCFAFDTGPGNVLMDYWVNKHKHQRYDDHGNWASEGQFNLTLLNALLDEEYFSRGIPKSTGRELFNGPWLEAKIKKCGLELDPVHVQATLLTFTVTTIVSDLARYCSPQEIYICGGGAHNEILLTELEKMASEYSVDSTASLGIDPDWVEAVAFAWMARMAMEDRAVNTQPFTGANGPVPLGAVYRAR